MKRFLSFFILIGVLGYFSYPYWDDIKYRFFLFPCSEPIQYNLGTFDSGFNISKEYFLNALTLAEGVWEKPFEKELFVYTPEEKDSILKINLVYDYRQEATSKLASLGVTVKDTQASYDALRSRFEILKSKYSSEKDSFTLAVNNFNIRQKNYEDQVKYWNAKGGAPEGEYNKLINEQNTLNTEAKVLQTRQNTLSSMVEEINSLVAVLNRQASNLNISVNAYNTIGSSLGESFEEGVYTKDALGEKIDIFEFSSKNKLVRILAHEFGHALGLGHVEDPQAIMYEKNHGNKQILTEADKTALKAICNLED